MNIFINEVKTIFDPFVSIQFNYFGISIVVIITAILIVTLNRG